MAVRIAEDKRQKRIEQLRVCALGIADEAEKIYGDLEYPCDLKVTITMEHNKIPEVMLERSFVPNKLVVSLLPFVRNRLMPFNFIKSEKSIGCFQIPFVAIMLI